MNDRLRYTIYLSSAIEHGTPDEEAKTWKEQVKKELGKPDVGIYDPIEQEIYKTGRTVKEACEYLTGLKRGGKWDLFHEQLNKIWWGEVKADYNRIDMLKLFRQRALIDGNRKDEFSSWGDEEAVVRSDFIIVYLDKNVKTVGTYREIVRAYDFNIPVYLILSNQTKTDANSTLIDMVVQSGGEIFYSVSDCIKFIKEKYNI